MILGAVHKGLPKSGEGGCPVRTFYGQRGFFRCGRPHFFAQKPRIFEIYSVSTKGEGVHFSRFCADVL